MAHEDDEDVEKVVFEVLEEILRPSLLDILFKRPRKRIKRADKLVKDLKIDSDDLSFLFVPRLEKKLGIKVPVKEWGAVFTVQDTIDLLKRHRQKGTLDQDH